MTYDNRYRPMENKLVKDSPPTTHADYTYQEDGVGNITQLSDAVDSTYNRTFSYDDLNRLKTAKTHEAIRVGLGRWQLEIGSSFPSRRQASCQLRGPPYAASSGATTYVSAASYQPFGPEASVSFGNGTTKTMTYDNRYRRRPGRPWQPPLVTLRPH